MATIGAISKGVVSERRRIRSAGRAWLNLCRTEYIKRKAQFEIEHVSSHKGTVSPEQIGNDAADNLANKYRIQGERLKAAPYLTETEEPLFLKHSQTNIQVTLAAT